MDLHWLAQQGFERLPDFLTALAIGLLIGLERERNPSAKAGLRTFAIVALTGAAATALADALASPALIAVGLGAVALTMVAAYYRDASTADADPGTTTVAAALACYLLAAMALAGWSKLAVMLAIVTTVLLYFKAELGGFARALERRDLISIFQFAVVTFIILPLLPDTDMGPYQALNPRHVWWMVVLISGVSLAGYVALRRVGHRHAILLGLLGGLVSSTATTLAYARYAASNERLRALAVTVILSANLMVLVRITVLAAVVAPAVVEVLAPVFGVALAAGFAVFAFGLVRREEKRELEMPHISNPVELRAAFAFAALYGLVLVLSAWLEDLFGSGGVYATAAVSGLADVDAIALSSMRLSAYQALSATQATVAIAIAVGSNIVFKLCIAGFAGGRALAVRSAPGMVAILAGLALGIVLFA
ncbi:MAG: magnesium transporter MgtC [Betaproteobacteria bacterium RIFCSPLOWO2_02_FULL_65_24]|nr:MAG: magnesium transporter MgtC [Betaproteobacteria bacterium RIFCSPLOWO2_02_FULL_65_24]OGA82982.1 MAG: magnesium transporter MgtC [Betaproteobacteria bacterium RIFCSPLOWO2_12_FULL_66_14]